LETLGLVLGGGAKVAAYQPPAPQEPSARFVTIGDLDYDR
jgi:hypothetical protein